MSSKQFSIFQLLDLGQVILLCWALVFFQQSRADCYQPHQVIMKTELCPVYRILSSVPGTKWAYKKWNLLLLISCFLSIFLSRLSSQSHRVLFILYMSYALAQYLIPWQLHTYNDLSPKSWSYFVFSLSFVCPFSFIYKYLGVWCHHIFPD